MLSLDVLRGIAILLVLLHHAIAFRGDIGVLGIFVRPLCELGWVGVDLFFVLSGFLIGSLIFKEIERTGNFRARRFLARRGFKIWPAYFALVALAALKAHHHGYGIAGIWNQFWPNIAQVQNYKLNLALPHTWSLAVEEHFYLVLTAVVAITVRARPDWVARHGATALLVTILTITANRIYVGLAIPFRLELHFAATHIRADTLLAGVLLAHQATFAPSRWARWLKYRWWLLVIGVALVLPAAVIARTRVWMHTVGYTIIYIGFSFILIGALSFSTWAQSRKSIFASLALPISWVGVSSYGIYLWHADLSRMPVEFWLAPRLQRALPDPIAWVIGMTVYICLAIGIGYLLSVAIERPTLCVREKLFPAAGATRGTSGVAERTAEPAATMRASAAKVDVEVY